MRQFHRLIARIEDIIYFQSTNSVNPGEPPSYFSIPRLGFLFSLFLSLRSCRITRRHTSRRTRVKIASRQTTFGVINYRATMQLMAERNSTDSERNPTAEKSDGKRKNSHSLLRHDIYFLYDTLVAILSTLVNLETDTALPFSLPSARSRRLAIARRVYPPPRDRRMKYNLREFNPSRFSVSFLSRFAEGKVASVRE